MGAQNDLPLGVCVPRGTEDPAGAGTGWRDGGLPGPPPVPPQRPADPGADSSL